MIELKDYSSRGLWIRLTGTSANKSYYSTHPANPGINENLDKPTDR